jgi:hypothetical protein
MKGCADAAVRPLVLGVTQEVSPRAFAVLWRIDAVLVGGCRPAIDAANKTGLVLLGSLNLCNVGKESPTIRGESLLTELKVLRRARKLHNDAYAGQVLRTLSLSHNLNGVG